MNSFKVGDKVTPIRVDRYTDYNSDQRREMLGRTLLVRSVHYAESSTAIFAGVPGEGCWRWHPNDLRMVSDSEAAPEEIAASKKPKPIRRGDLVEYDGDICVVLSKGADRVGDYMVASLTSDPDYYYAKIDELTRIGSIRKKIKRLKAQMGGGK